MDVDIDFYNKEADLAVSLCPYYCFWNLLYTIQYNTMFTLLGDWSISITEEGGGAKESC